MRQAQVQAQAALPSPQHSTTRTTWRSTWKVWGPGLRGSSRSHSYRTRMGAQLTRMMTEGAGAGEVLLALALGRRLQAGAPPEEAHRLQARQHQHPLALSVLTMTMTMPKRWMVTSAGAAAGADHQHLHQHRLRLHKRAARLPGLRAAIAYRCDHLRLHLHQHQKPRVPAVHQHALALALLHQALLPACLRQLQAQARSPAARQPLQPRSHQASMRWATTQTTLTAASELTPAQLFGYQRELWFELWLPYRLPIASS